MSYQVEAQAAYVLHTRPYRETSLLVDLFTLEQGRVSAVVKGGRSPRSRMRAMMQPFTPLQVSWRGRHELKTLIQAEAVASPMFLKGSALICGLYVNELLERLLQPSDPHPRLYVYYQYVLNELLAASDIELALRTFEQQLLQQLGYQFDVQQCQPQGIYRYDGTQGFIPVTQITDALKAVCFSGEQLQGIVAEQYHLPEIRRAAKRLMRLALEAQLGSRPLRSRELLQGYVPKRIIPEL
ncbi:DNA replication and repair protein RecO [Amphritea atlantica]|uniref:DNA repair protein RecO n=1 Tax=Amphritea atlantica TaxID=355243 RepID=A0A1H9HKL6_9GAMM|nr:DNA repair protein RecO [Amphritea atlantica]SEQ62889.1 DNA replication and repair protein RecO [Amphritea atlantica]